MSLTHEESSQKTIASGVHTDSMTLLWLK